MNALLVYLGRQGPMGRFARQLMEAATDADIHVALSKQNEDAHLFRSFENQTILLDCFQTSAGAFISPHKIIGARGALARHIRSRNIRNVVFLMPHVWSPFMSPAIRAAGATYNVVIHDAVAHPGDPGGLVHDWIHSDLRRAHRIFTLSNWVSMAATRRWPALEGRVTTLFHPDLGKPLSSQRPRPTGPLRLAFIGRIQRYKGLPLLVDALEALASSGVPVDLWVRGAGDIEPVRAKLERLGARIDNVWCTEEQLSEAVLWSDAVVASHTEASQSGVVAFAFGHGRPVLATPVGGLVEQITPGQTGLIAAAPTSEAIAAQIRSLASDPDLLARLRAGVIETSYQRSSDRFLRELLEPLECKGRRT